MWRLICRDLGVHVGDSIGRCSGLARGSWRKGSAAVTGAGSTPARNARSRAEGPRGGGFGLVGSAVRPGGARWRSGGHEDECGRIWRQSFYGTGGVDLRGHTEGSGEDEKPRTADAEPSTIAMEVGMLTGAVGESRSDRRSPTTPSREGEAEGLVLARARGQTRL
ncbi:hypothetical protein M6B38_106270 [Iris pallida]|uniref:Uncharacterized protein n=1 Tax=Iris pallida TaxID=29817 RepID=A0AAX6ET30_IRIPA|nr:hypothetical protein M6B38_106270 [Iris pallida]